MAKPQSSYPESATNGARKERPESNGEAAVKDALATHGDDIAAAIEQSDELADAITTAILVIASADDEEVGHVTDSAANLVAAADGLSTDGAAELADELGENADTLSESLDVILTFQREGHLEDLVTVAASVSESLSPEEIEELSTLLEDNGSELVAVLETVLELQREGHLDDLVETAKTLSVLEIDEDAARGMNEFFGAIGDAQRDSEPIGLMGSLSAMLNRDVRFGLGYLVSFLKAKGRRIRDRS
ncbi:hypothetical protein C477_17895 [Haloterrigena salina JCM 13891]|uniref:DUF1641 domain-containing protein n=1 Tax=Haloterrigena salina JCM 13891 TaxID=1227488 RepID=M0BX31_9EURY|nr:DUF1641 domain-containing protein [Haloterrigena salina]ELZ15571.1 hypothetical protein C477_17895 [Haloterrigena salina JCM 13891]